MFKTILFVLLVMLITGCQTLSPVNPNQDHLSTYEPGQVGVQAYQLKDIKSIVLIGAAFSKGTKLIKEKLDKNNLIYVYKDIESDANAFQLYEHYGTIPLVMFENLNGKEQRFAASEKTLDRYLVHSLEALNQYRSKNPSVKEK